MERLTSLITDARSGAPAAWGEIFARFQDMAYAVAYSRLGDHHLAQDVAQDAFVEAFLNLPKLKEPEAFPGWFRQIVFRQCIRSIRRKTLPTAPLDDWSDIPSREPDPRTILEERETFSLALDALVALPEDQRLTASLFYLHDYSCSQVAACLGIPVTTVKKRLHTARKRMHAQMAQPSCDWRRAA